MGPDTLLANSPLVDTLLQDTILRDTLQGDTALADSAAALTGTGGVNPLIWILITAVAIIAVVVLVIFFLRGGHRKAKSSQQAYLDGLKALLDDDPNSAAREFRDSVLHDTENIDAYIRLGRLMRERGKSEKAAEIHQSLTARPSLTKAEELRIYEELLLDYIELQRTEKSIALLKEMLQIAPRNSVYLRRLLGILVCSNRTEEALRVLKLHRKTFSSKEEPALWYAEVARLIFASDEEKAASILNQAQKFSKNHPAILTVQAEAFVNKGQWGKARSLIDKFVKLYPEQVEHVLGLAERAYFEEGAYEKLKPLYENILDRFPEKDEVRGRLIKLYTKQGKTKQATELIKHGLASNPADVVLLAELVSLKLAGKDLKGAQAAFNKLKDIIHIVPELCPECGCVLTPGKWICTSCGEISG